MSVVSEISLSRNVAMHGISSISAKNESNLLEFSMSFCISYIVIFKGKLEHMDHVWVTSGLLSGSSGSTSMTHFQPLLVAI